MVDKKFQRFGKYLILDHLVDGGMAKICRARFLGEQANKLVAVKMVQPQFSKDQAFAKMFQDELKVSFALLHPNIAQIYDYGKVHDQLYTAMEYVDGLNLKQYLERLKEKNYVFPVEISVYITAQVCQGLYYAHTFTDKLTGSPLNIIHRDISPHNIMLTYDGAVKVIDFGIAKSSASSEATQAGTIKGKLSYLAPEYLEGMELDARYDVFAVGVTLWELLCSRKLFTANNDLAVLKQIQACKIVPPSQINPNVPKELDTIVMKSLSKDRTLRFENMDQFNRALVKFLYSTYPDFNATDLAYFAKELFKEEIKRDREKFVEFGKIDVRPYMDDLRKEELSGKGPAGKQSAGAKDRDQTSASRRVELDLGDTNSGIRLELNKTTTRKITKAQVKSLAIGSQKEGKNSTEDQSASKSLSLNSRDKDKTTTKSRKTKVDQALVEDSKKASRLIPIALVGAIVLAYFQPGLVLEWTGIDLRSLSSQDTDRSISSIGNPIVDKSGEKIRKSNESDNTGKLTLKGLDLTMDVYVNGDKRDYRGIALDIPLNQRVTILIKKEGFKSFMKTVEIGGGKTSAVIEIPDLTRAKLGLLTSSLNYPSGSILIFTVDGEKMEKEMPFSGVQVPEGTYQAKVINRSLGIEKEVKFNVEENKENRLE